MEFNKPEKIEKMFIPPDDIKGWVDVLKKDFTPDEIKTFLCHNVENLRKLEDLISLTESRLTERQKFVGTEKARLEKMDSASAEGQRVSRVIKETSYEIADIKANLHLLRYIQSDMLADIKKEQDLPF
jgi:hypothetical protein